MSPEKQDTGTDEAEPLVGEAGQAGQAVLVTVEPESGTSDDAAAVPGLHGTEPDTAQPDAEPDQAGRGADPGEGQPSDDPGESDEPGEDDDKPETDQHSPVSGAPDGYQPGGILSDPARSARRDKEDGPEPASALTAERLLTVVERPPVGGWRLWLYRATFGYVNLGDSDSVRIRRALEHRIAAKVGPRTRYVPVLSRKGGVGKTTVTTLLGMVLAEVREDRVIAMDANPDRGTLSDRSPGRADYTARQLVQNRFMVNSFAQLSPYVARENARLHVLASDTDPAVAHAFDEADYRAVTDVLSRYYSIVLTDSGTGMVHSVMSGTLEKANTVVLVSGGSIDEARLASETLSWLEAHGRHDLVAKAIVVINLAAGYGTKVDVDQIEDHFLSRVGTVLRLPFDPHLAEGSRIELAKLRPATRAAAIELAAHVVDRLVEGELED